MLLLLLSDIHPTLPMHRVNQGTEQRLNWGGFGCGADLGPRAPACSHVLPNLLMVALRAEMGHAHFLEITEGIGKMHFALVQFAICSYD